MRTALGHPAEPADATLFDGLRRRDLDALRELYRRYGGIVYASARIVARRSDRSAEDLTVAAFVALWRQAAPLGDQPAHGPLLRTLGRVANGRPAGQAC